MTDQHDQDLVEPIQPATCTDYWAEPLRTGGEVHRCTLVAVHVFDRATHWHRCSCSATWVDDLQILEAKRERGEIA